MKVKLTRKDNGEEIVIEVQRLSLAEVEQTVHGFSEGKVKVELVDEQVGESR
jgi:hypothetical protein